MSGTAQSQVPGRREEGGWRVLCPAAGFSGDTKVRLTSPTICVQSALVQALGRLLEQRLKGSIGVCLVDKGGEQHVSAAR